MERYNRDDKCDRIENGKRCGREFHGIAQRI